NSVAQLPLEPSLPFLRGHVGSEDSNADALPCKNRLQSASDIALLGIHRIDMTAAPCLQLGLDDLDEAALLGLETLRVEVFGLSDQKPLPSFGLRVVVPPVQVADVVGSIGVHQEHVQAYAQHGMIASMLLERALDLVLQLAV